MFGFFTPRCPVELKYKVWVERQMTFLADRLGIDRLRRASVLTPGQLANSPDELFTQLRDHLGVRIPVTWEAVDELPELGTPPAEDGRYLESAGAAKIRVETRQLKKREPLAANFVHELCRAILLGEKHLTPDDELAEPTVELLSVFLGTGILTANHCVNFRQFLDGLWEGHVYSKHRHLAADSFGYALALFSWRREESPKSWQHALRPDARDAMLGGLTYLNRTDDTVFTDRVQNVTSTGAIEDDLLGKSDSRRLLALWLLAERDSIDGQLTEALQSCLEHSDPQFPIATLQVLEKHPQLVEHVEDHLEILLNHDRPGIPLQVLRVVSQRSPAPTRWLQQAESILKNSQHLPTQLAAIHVLASNQARATESLPALLDFACLAVARDTDGLEEVVAAMKMLTEDMSPIAAELRAHVTDESIALRLNTCLE